MTTPRGPGRNERWRSAVRGAVTERLGLKATALALAVLLCVVASARQPTQGYVRVHVHPALSVSRILVKDSVVASAANHVDFDPATVLVTGPRRAVRRIATVQPFSLTIARGDTVRHVADLGTTGLGVLVSPSQVKVQFRMGGQ